MLSLAFSSVKATMPTAWWRVCAMDPSPCRRTKNGLRSLTMILISSLRTSPCVASRISPTPVEITRQPRRSVLVCLSARASTSNPTRLAGMCCPNASARIQVSRQDLQPAAGHVALPSRSTPRIALGGRLVQLKIHAQGQAGGRYAQGTQLGLPR